MSGSASGDGEQRIDRARIEVNTHADRSDVETLYLELRDLAKQYGLTVEYRLAQRKPEDLSDP